MRLVNIKCEIHFGPPMLDLKMVPAPPDSAASWVYIVQQGGFFPKMKTWLPDPEWWVFSFYFMLTTLMSSAQLFTNDPLWLGLFLSLQAALLLGIWYWLYQTGEKEKQEAERQQREWEERQRESDERWKRQRERWEQQRERWKQQREQWQQGSEWVAAGRGGGVEPLCRRTLMANEGRKRGVPGIGEAEASGGRRMGRRMHRVRPGQGEQALPAASAPAVRQGRLRKRSPAVSAQNLPPQHASAVAPGAAWSG